MGDETACKLYVRFPKKIVDALEVKNLHADIVEVKLPRQKSTRWCIISCANEQKRIDVEATLKKLLVNGKKISIKPFKSGKRIQKRSILSTKLEISKA